MPPAAPAATAVPAAEPTGPAKAASAGSGRRTLPIVLLAIAGLLILAGIVVVAGRGGSDGSTEIDSAGSDVATAGFDEGVEEQDDGVETTPPDEVTTTEAPTTTTTQVTTTLAPLDAARAGLASTQSEDRAAVESAVGYWVPQVSSKYVGLEADGIIYDEMSILQNHRNLVDRYAPTRVALLSSSDYSTFSKGGFWVTIAVEPFASAEGANGWCDQMQIPSDHCFAKFLSHTAGHDGATVARK